MSRRRFDKQPTVPDAFREAKADYDAGKTDRFTRVRSGLLTTGSGADYHFQETQWLRLMEYARDMARNDPVVGSMIKRSASNVIQGGFAVEPMTGDSALDDELQAGFAAWASDPVQCDQSHRFTLDQMAYQAACDDLTVGGAFLLPNAESGALQYVEYHRCRKPTNTTLNVVLGVHLDEWRRPLEYWFTQDDIDPLRKLTRVSEVDKYAARDEDGEERVFHVFDADRHSQTRGASALAPVIKALGMFEDLNFAHLVKAQIAACFVVFKQLAPGADFGSSGQAGAQSEEILADGSTRTVEDWAPGTVYEGRPGETLTGFTPTVPNSEYFEHARFTLQMIAAAINLPLIALLLDGRETNFSGWRGAIDQAKIGWRRTQKRLGEQVYLKAYRFWVRRQAALNSDLREKLSAKDAKPYAARCTYPTWPYIEPIKDIRARRDERRALLISPRQQLRELGRDWYQMIDEALEDNNYAIVRAVKRALALWTETGIWVEPAQFLSLDANKPLTAKRYDTRSGESFGVDDPETIDRAEDMEDREGADDAA